MSWLEADAHTPVGPAAFKGDLGLAIVFPELYHRLLAHLFCLFLALSLVPKSGINSVLHVSPKHLRTCLWAIQTARVWWHKTLFFFFFPLECCYHMPRYCAWAYTLRPPHLGTWLPAWAASGGRRREISWFLCLHPAHKSLPLHTQHLHETDDISAFCPLHFTKLPSAPSFSFFPCFDI